MNINAVILGSHKNGVSVKFETVDEYTDKGQEAILLNTCFGPDYVESVGKKYYSKNDGKAQIDRDMIAFDEVHLVDGRSYQVILTELGKNVIIINEKGELIFPTTVIPKSVDCREVVVASFIFGLVASDDEVKSQIADLLRSGFIGKIDQIPSLDGQTNAVF